MTCDHLVSSPLKMQGLEGEKYGLSVKDLYTGLIAAYPVTEKDAASTVETQIAYDDGAIHALVILHITGGSNAFGSGSER